MINRKVLRKRLCLVMFIGIAIMGITGGMLSLHFLPQYRSATGWLLFLGFLMTDIPAIVVCRMDVTQHRKVTK